MRACAYALICLALPAAAVAAPPEGAPRWTFGALAIERDAPYRDYDEGVLVAPLLRFEGDRLWLRGVRGGAVLWREDGWELGPFLQVRFDGYDADKSDFLAGMDDREFSVDAGFGASWRNDKVGQIELSAATDLLGRSGGHELELSYTALFRAGGFTFIPALAAKWQSDHLVDYYYGVREEEALPGRPAYEGDSAFVPELSLLVSRRLGKHWSLFGRVGHSWLPGEIRDSPIVDASGRTSILLGLGYSPVWN